MTRRVTIEWPDAAAFDGRDGRPIRILAVSDNFEASLADMRTRKQLLPLDLILGCGDLNGEDLGFIADALGAPLLFVRGNHDGGEKWDDAAEGLPAPLRAGSVVRADNLAIAALPWPGPTGRAARIEDGTGWRQALGVALRRLGRRGPLVVVSHVPPLGVGDVPTDAYHRGQRAYRWLLDRLAPRLWLHGHTPMAACAQWRIEHEGTTLLNVTGAVLIELCPPGSGAGTAERPLDPISS